MFIVPGRTEVILLSWFIVCCECFIQQWGSGAKPSRGPGGRSPQKLEHFLKYIAWNLRPGENERHFDAIDCVFFSLQCTPALCCFSSRCTMFGILGAWPLAPPPKSALDYGPVMAVTHLSRVGELVHVALLTPNSLTQRLLGSAGVVSLYRIK